MEIERLLKISERGKFEMQNLIPDDKSLGKLALFFQNFSDQTRIKILSALAIREMCVNDLAKVLNLNQTTLSHQLKTLKAQDLVDFRREGKILVYFLVSADVNEMMMFALRSIA